MLLFNDAMSSDDEQPFADENDNDATPIIETDKEQNKITIALKDYKMLAGDLSSLQCQLKSRDRTASLQRQQLDRQKKEIEELDQKLELKQKECDELSEELHMAHNKNQKLNFEVQDVKLEQELEATLSEELKNENTILRKLLEQEQKRNREQSKELRELKEQLNATQNRLEAQISDLTQFLGNGTSHESYE